MDHTRPRAGRLAALALLALAGALLAGCVDEPAEERQGWPVGDEDASIAPSDAPRAPGAEAPREDARAPRDA